MSQFFASGGQSFGVSVSVAASVLHSGAKQNKAPEFLEQIKIYLQSTKENGQLMIKRLKLSDSKGF